jgi:hypothetical protein
MALRVRLNSHLRDTRPWVRGDIRQKWFRADREVARNACNTPEVAPPLNSRTGLPRHENGAVHSYMRVHHPDWRTMSDPAPIDVRQLAALLANPDIRATYAEVVLGMLDGDHATPRRHRMLSALLKAGLVESSPEGGVVATSAPFRSLLDQYPKREKQTGIDRFLRDGRIDRYPSNPDDRRELLEWVAHRCVAGDEVVTERELNGRLEEYSEDFAVLRRYLVDFGLLWRTRSGSSYSRAER